MSRAFLDLEHVKQKARQCPLLTSFSFFLNWIIVNVIIKTIRSGVRRDTLVLVKQGIKF